MLFLEKRKVSKFNHKTDIIARVVLLRKSCDNEIKLMKSRIKRQKEK